MHHLVLWFSFSLKTLFLYHRGGGKVFKPYPLSVAGLAPLPGFPVFSLSGSRGKLVVGCPSAAGSCLSPRAPFTTGVLSAKASSSHPSLAPRVPLSHS